jgi:hypothetical protein
VKVDDASEGSARANVFDKRKRGCVRARAMTWQGCCGARTAPPARSEKGNRFLAAASYAANCSSVTTVGGAAAAAALRRRPVPLRAPPRRGAAPRARAAASWAAREPGGGGSRRTFGTAVAQTSQMRSPLRANQFSAQRVCTTPTSPRQAQPSCTPSAA